MPGAENGLSPEVERVAREELGEDPVSRENDIETVRQWLVRQPGLNARTDRTTILRYLRGCKFSLEKTKTKMEVYYTSKGANPDMFQGRDPLDPNLRSIIKLGLMVPLPGYDAQGRKVIFGRLGGWDPSKQRPEDLFKAAGMLFDVLFLDDEQTTIMGIVQANDMTGLTLNHVASLPLPLIKRVLKTWQNGYPLRPKSVHYVHTPSAFDALFNLFKPFMREKMKKRIHIHGNNLESLHKSVPREMLPQEYGGTAGTLASIAEYWLRRMEHHRDWFLEDEKYRADSKRNRSQANEGGSFRKLNLD
ncbi:retinol-binding protein pinta-like [Eriocheir sinensis]|uniref:retinol-binding protein pinta-like n=1 Tax=Eriocheir sinensis TaxID=95602 RepID=UPI0021C8C40C|nr:retinol-binding protein pinta-like [Eriocheir sinensis]XP_050699349.1 retinol-binding protein pinta-like [Eriocheir sinensis]